MNYPDDIEIYMDDKSIRLIILPWDGNEVLAFDAQEDAKLNDIFHAFLLEPSYVEFAKKNNHRIKFYNNYHFQKDVFKALFKFGEKQ